MKQTLISVLTALIEFYGKEKGIKIFQKLLDYL